MNFGQPFRILSKTSENATNFATTEKTTLIHSNLGGMPTFQTKKNPLKNIHLQGGGRMFCY